MTDLPNSFINQHNITILAVILFALMGVGFVVVWINNQRIRDELHQRGVTTQARVMDRVHERQTTSNNNFNNNLNNNNNFNTMPSTTTDHYSITYSFTVNGVGYDGRQSVGLSTYDALREGSPVEVVYLPDNPTTSRLASTL